MQCRQDRRRTEDQARGSLGQDPAHQAEEHQELQPELVGGRHMVKGEQALQRVGPRHHIGKDRPVILGLGLHRGLAISGGDAHGEEGVVIISHG